MPAQPFNLIERRDIKRKRKEGYDFGVLAEEYHLALRLGLLDTDCRDSGIDQAARTFRVEPKDIRAYLEIS